MSYPLIETSDISGRPVELYEFKYSTVVWRFTSADVEIEHDGNTYTPLAGLDRGAFDETSDPTQSTLTISGPGTIPLAGLFLEQPPSDLITVTIYGKHLGDPDFAAPSGFVVVWKGRVLNCDNQDSRAEFTCESVFSSMLRPGLAPRYSHQCRVPLYGAHCGVARASFRTVTTADTIAGLTVTAFDAAGSEPQYYAGGYMTWVHNVNGNVEQRMIVDFNSVTGALQISVPPVGLAEGQTIEIFPGCDHLTGTCLTRFNNIANFRGEPYIPSKNPFGGTSIF